MTPMQTAHCTVRLAGNLQNTVDKRDITIAELALIKAIHGDGSVVNVQPAGEINRTDSAERQRLVSLYAKRESSSGRAVIEKLFPGEFARLPQTFADIGMSFEGQKFEHPEPAAEQPAAKRGPGRPPVKKEEPALA